MKNTLKKFHWHKYPLSLLSPNSVFSFSALTNPTLPLLPFSSPCPSTLPLSFVFIFPIFSLLPYPPIFKFYSSIFLSRNTLINPNFICLFDLYLDLSLHSTSSDFDQCPFHIFHVCFVQGWFFSSGFWWCWFAFQLGFWILIDFCSVGCYGFSLEVIVWGYVSYSFEQNPVLVYFAIKKLFFSCPGTEVFLSLSVCSLIFFFMSIFSLNYVLMSALIDGIFLVFASSHFFCW